MMDPVSIERAYGHAAAASGSEAAYRRRRAQKKQRMIFAAWTRYATGGGKVVAFPNVAAVA